MLGVVFIVFLTPILDHRADHLVQDAPQPHAERRRCSASPRRAWSRRPDALQAIATNRVDAVTGTLPLADQASTLTKRTAWSDLRKGVLLVAVGFAFVFHGMVEEGSASWFGLVLLFVGIGYVVLWYFEDRQAAAFNAGRASVLPTTGGGPGDGKS